MCGISGILSFQATLSSEQKEALNLSLSCIEDRGPDNKGLFYTDNVGLGHTRLSIIDVSAKANQPFTDKSGRYTIILNGEIYNYKSLKNQYLKDVSLASDSDTEVLLYLYIKLGKKILDIINGFFAFAIYDSQEQRVFIARDRIGIKPLLYVQQDEFFCFASDLRSLLAFPIDKKIDKTALSLYLQLNYIPAPYSIIQAVKKLLPGQSIEIDIAKKQVDFKRYYEIKQKQVFQDSYKKAQESLYELLYNSVEKRMLADVPLGCFLSGGIDSSVISGIAAKLNPHLHTFSIGYKDNPFFDESKHAERMANFLSTNHHSFILSTADLYDQLFPSIAAMDEPFADSSAVVVYALSQQTKKFVTVALSGDGADELFAGYNKHYALYKSSQKSIQNTLIKSSSPLWKILPKSRNSFLSNRFRQMDRYSVLLKTAKKERCWFLSTIATEKEASLLLKTSNSFDSTVKNTYLEGIEDDFADYLMYDQRFVLPNDMLKKVDLMSMGNSLEVRVPFLDHEVVEFANSLETAFKINKNGRKRILKDSFKEFLPDDIAQRPKHGFEVPMQDWLKNELMPILDEKIFNEERIKEQALFDYSALIRLKQQFLSVNPKDAAARIWGLLVFQLWYSKNIE
jgi:asparagine synthase (glutamine-hydrolysing)